MKLNLIKLCVGVERVEQLREWQQMRLREKRAAGEEPELRHTTRMTPRRKDELLDGGSLYWVIKGIVRVRQPLRDIRQFVDADGIGRCNLIFENKLILTRPQPRRAFQGWRYLAGKDAPTDLPLGANKDGNLSEEMREELAELGLL
jgi:hypothetical protein